MENTKTPSGEQVAGSPIFKKAMGAAEGYLRKPLRIKKLLNDSYQRASKKKDIGQIAHDVWESFQVLFRLISAAVTGKYHGIPTSTLLGGIAVLLYFMSPIDAIPDFIPVIGLLDDAALLAWFMTSIKEEMDHFATWESSAAGAAATGHVSLAPKPQATDLSGEEHSRPSGDADHDTSLRARTTDATRVPSRTDHSGGDPGGNVR